MIQKFLFQKIFDLVKQPHLSDFPFYLKDNPIRKIRTYTDAQETSYTQLYLPQLDSHEFVFILKSIFKFRKTKFFSDRTPPEATITLSTSIQVKDVFNKSDKNFSTIKSPSKKINTLLIYIDGLSPCLLENNQNSGSVMKNISEIFKDGFIHNKYFSASEWTLPNLASMFLGILPSQHGMTTSRSDGKSSFIIPKFQNIFQYLSGFGIKTNIFSSVPYMNPNFGFQLGTDMFFYHKNLHSRKLFSHLHTSIQNRGQKTTESHLDCIFLMDVHHKLDGNLAAWDPKYDQYVKLVSQKTRLSTYDARNLISRAIELDNSLKTFLDGEVLKFYDNIVLISDHGSARLRENQELCVDDARARTTFCLTSKNGMTIDPNKVLSLTALPTILSRLYELPMFPSLWTEQNNLIFTQAIFPKLPYRLRIRAENQRFDFISDNVWCNYDSFKLEFSEFLDSVSSATGDTIEIENFKSQFNLNNKLK